MEICKSPWFQKQVMDCVKHGADSDFVVLQEFTVGTQNTNRLIVGSWRQKAKGAYMWSFLPYPRKYHPSAISVLASVLA